MSALIKSGTPGDISVVRPLSVMRAERHAVSEAEEERRSLLMQIAALEREVRERDTAITAAQVEIGASYSRGQDEGRQLGRTEAEDQQSARLVLLENALRQVQADLSDGIKSLERLSVLLARDCLEIILGDPDHRADLVSQIIRTQVGRIDNTMLVDIKVSREDFSDEDALWALAVRAGVTRTLLDLGADMPPGGCIMTLRLGKVDIGLGRQWGVLREALEQIPLQDGTHER